MSPSGSTSHRTPPPRSRACRISASSLPGRRRPASSRRICCR